MDQQERMAALFDRVADTYDRMGVHQFQPIAARLTDELAPVPGERALDIGCGRGAVLLRLASAVGPTGRATGLDLAPAMVAAAAEEAAAANLPVAVVVGDAQDPDLPAESFEVLASSLVLFFLPDPATALSRWRALLVGDGRLGVSTFGTLSPWWGPVDAVFKPFLASGMRDARTTGAAGQFASDAGMEQLLAGTGFTDVHTARDVVRVRFDDVEHWRRWTMSTGQRSMWEQVPDDQRRAVEEATARAVEETRRHTDDGRMGFDQQVRYTVGRKPEITR